MVLTDGRISEQGTYKDLMSHNGAFAELIATYLNEVEEFSDDEEESKVTGTVLP